MEHVRIDCSVFCNIISVNEFRNCVSLTRWHCSRCLTPSRLHTCVYTAPNHVHCNSEETFASSQTTQLIR
jgi:hypothetical protein